MTSRRTTKAFDKDQSIEISKEALNWWRSLTDDEKKLLAVLDCKSTPNTFTNKDIERMYRTSNKY